MIDVRWFHDIRESDVDMVTLHDLLNPELLTDCHHYSITKLSVHCMCGRSLKDFSLRSDPRH